MSFIFAESILIQDRQSGPINYKAHGTCFAMEVCCKILVYHCYKVYYFNYYSVHYMYLSLLSKHIPLSLWFTWMYSGLYGISGPMWYTRISVVYSSSIQHTWIYVIYSGLRDVLRLCGISMSIQHTWVYVVYSCLCGILMSIQYTQVYVVYSGYVVYSCLYSIPWSMWYTKVYGKLKFMWYTHQRSRRWARTPRPGRAYSWSPSPEEDRAEDGTSQQVVGSISLAIGRTSVTSLLVLTDLRTVRGFLGLSPTSASVPTLRSELCFFRA